MSENIQNKHVDPKLRFPDFQAITEFILSHPYFHKKLHH